MTRELDPVSPRVLRELFGKYGISPHKQWGQNFLIDGNIVRKIVAAIEPDLKDRVVEIGPGAGALTSRLAGAVDKVLALEIDRGLVLLLQELFADRDNVEIIGTDAMTVCWQELIEKYFPGFAPVKLVSNLPYVISGPFLYSLMEECFPFDTAVLMFQKEVAARITAAPGSESYGALSVICQYYCRSSMLFSLGSNVFWPKPNVGSAVVKLQPATRLLPPEVESSFRKLVKGLFRQRRKTISNNMQSYLSLSLGTVTGILDKAGIDGRQRPEELSPGQFANLARLTYNYHK